MEETTSAVMTETAPQETDMTAEVPADGTTPESTVPSEDSTDTGTMPTEESENASGIPANTESAPSAIRYKFNHRTETVSMDEAPTLLQKGRKLEQITPQLDRLRFLAEASGKKDLQEFIDELETSWDRAEYQKYLKTAGGNEEIAKTLQEVAKKERTGKFKTSDQLDAEQKTKDEDALTQRMGEELSDLMREFPDVKEFSQLPETVVHEAAEDGIPLKYAYIKYLYENEKRSHTQIEAQQKAASASAGPMRSAPDSAEKKPPVTKAKGTKGESSPKRDIAPRIRNITPKKIITILY